MANNTLSSQFHQKIILTPQHAGKRLDVTINELFEDFSRSQIQKWIKDGSITLNNNSTKAKHIVIGDEEIEIKATLIPTNEWLAENIELNIVYEDESIIVINKPANMVTHPGAGNMTGTISNALLSLNEIQKTLPRGGIVHRLDKDTTGLMIAAKSNLAYLNLTQQLSDRKVSRKYLAVVEGEIHESGTIDQPIGRDPNNRVKMTINYNGKQAITNYTPLEIYNGFTLVECKLETGRTHQIRVHMKSVNHPLVGDQTYNKSSSKLKNINLAAFPRQALHAYSLSFAHPLTHETLNFTCDMPYDMLNLILQLRSTISDDPRLTEDY
ncbi:RluA family pseudouridine synthase [Allofrancisella guangzhouensis]|uniref:Pseudouridine synthase n=1 Tax=Allofrancisella guangzhouensis TaxID=594679 RepID=A0A0A8E9M2_9GAMM|nr:RluA family pseudouridine synthase [Allofrancisella guangzhouensis]AJC48871.1 pseudouridine synthase [Allofrancisella guangzhouensis]MBK2026935.1 RluA family pseudouridine synthase [Allofrancisella guangzhouensis]MBK2043635.1 RluA family pseudouridine synthase [Allofrancisella guangzhouensis]MBK2045979.1 RluA family pseudouridine synthase [Allofrancisella guangzhouensis]